MPNQRISDLPDSGEILYDEIINFVQNGANVKGSISDSISIPTVETGSFTAHVFGFTTDVTTLVTWTTFGFIVVLDITPFSGISNSGKMAIMDMPGNLVTGTSRTMVSCPARFLNDVTLERVECYTNYDDVDITDGIAFFVNDGSGDLNWDTGVYKGTSDRFQIVYNLT